MREREVSFKISINHDKEQVQPNKIKEEQKTEIDKKEEINVTKE
jgi:hypothetical protein